MKNYEEVAQDVFRRRDEYDRIMTKRKKAVKKAIVTFSCFCVVAVGGIAAWQNGLLSYDGTKMESASAGNSDSLEGSLLMGSEDYIIVNELESVIDEDSKVASEVQDEDFVEMTREELIAYFGINVFPEVPLDVVEHGSRYGVYKMEQGTGEIYWDCQRICYDNEDRSRSIDMEFRKGDIPLTDMIFYYSTEEKSLINGTEVMIGQYGDSSFEVEMIYNNVGFRIHFRGLSQEEVIAVIDSILQEA